MNRLIRLAYGPFALGTLAPGEVEEVGPRVIREQLAEHIAPASLPTGERPLWRPAPTAIPAKPPSRRAPKPTEPPKRKVYKAGWARAKPPRR